MKGSGAWTSWTAWHCEGFCRIGKNKKERSFLYERRKLEEELEGEVVKITLVFVGLLLGSWCMAQEPWRPPLFFLVHGTGALAATAVLPGNYGPASGLLARGAGALAATASVGLLLGSWRRSLGGCALFPR